MNTPLEALGDGWSLDALVDVMVEQGYAEDAARIRGHLRRSAPDAQNIVHTAVAGRTDVRVRRVHADRRPRRLHGGRREHPLSDSAGATRGDPWEQPRRADLWFEVLPDGEADGQRVHAEQDRRRAVALVGEIVARASSEIPRLGAAGSL